MASQLNGGLLRELVICLFKSELDSDVWSKLTGHRILYDFDKFGDTPTCIGRVGKSLVDRTAYLEGYGLTEDGKITYFLCKRANENKCTEQLSLL